MCCINNRLIPYISSSIHFYMFKHPSFLFLLAICLSVFSTASGQRPPKREFRAVWVATVLNIDYPSQPTTDAKTLRREWIELLDAHHNTGINALIVQVRPAADALYPSALAPWSAYLTGRQGQAPRPARFDPLEFMIEETHRRGMEFHAWLNPYRATTSTDTRGLAPGHVLRQHPDWCFFYGGKYYLNPALPEVRRHVEAVVGELLGKYEIDGIHFDDYFYPYKKAGQPIPDSLDFDRYGKAFEDIEDWRRHNNDLLIRALHRRIKQQKPGISFGISPFGVWRNAARDSLGSDTRAGVTTYDDLYADVRKWLEQGWIDYVAPQLYWHIGHPAADFETLLNWWSQHTYGRHLYIGHGAYRIGTDSDSAWQDAREIARQMTIVRQNPKVDGHIFFSSNSLRKNKLDWSSHLRDSLYKIHALLPWRDVPGNVLPPPPDLRKIKGKRKGVKIKWKVDKEALRQKGRLYYVIYRFPEGAPGGLSDARCILEILAPSDNKKTVFWDTSAEAGRRYRYQVTALDRFQAESVPSRPLGTRAK